MKIVIPGGSGQVGNLLARHFHRNGHEVVVLSREARNADWRVVPWDGSTLGDWTREIDGADVVINLAGRSVNCRYNDANRKVILDSRVESTRIVGQAIARSTQPPRVWLQMSTATIYAHRFDAANDEYSGIIGGQEKNVPDTWRFSIDVAKAWEAAMQEKSTPGTRKVLLRAAMVMSPDADGVFDTLLALVRGGLGGRMGSGKQFMSWIHGEDFVRAIEWILERDELEGAVNLSSPNPLPNAAFMLELRRAWGIKSGKDFILVSHLAYKAFWPAKVPFSLMHIDTDHNFPETISYRDEWVEHPGAKLIVRTVQDSIARGRIVEEKGLNATHNARATDVSTTEPEKRSLIRHR